MAMQLRDRSKRARVTSNEPLVFQALSWFAEDVDLQHVLGEEDGANDTLYYIIKVFGSTGDGKTVSATIRNFTPYFYVRVPEDWTSREVKKFQEFLNTSMPHVADSILSVKKLERRDFWGFSNKQEFTFVRLSFRNIKAMRTVQKKLQYDVQVRAISPKKLKFKIYEANIEPFIRFIHINNLEPCGWIQLQPNTYTKSTEILESNCNIDVEVDWTNVEPFQCDNTAPFVIASFDIECYSSTGEFPVPKKDYKHVASQLYDAYKDKLEAMGEYNRNEGIRACLYYAMGLREDCPVYDDFHRAEPKDALSAAKKTAIARKIDEHLDDIYTVLSGKWSLASGEKPSRENIVATLTKLLGGNGDKALQLPALQGDPIIQIGTTFHVYGQRECCYRHILTLGSCDKIDGVEVEACETEEDLLLKWSKLIQATNPDVITGYNIFGFDFGYMYDRAKELYVQNHFMRLSRIVGNDRLCQFRENKLSSSALGDNILRFIDMEGRVLVDLMKVVQRDHKLDSYKLDNVAHHFMGMNKQDVTPNDIFRLQRGNAADRAIIADYCVQDCTLCNHLVMKLEIVANNMGMANVCLVPLSYIFMRGQGIKIFSLVLKECKDDGYLIPVVRPPFRRPSEEAAEDAEDDSYEGAIVLEPKEGIYIDDPVSVLDYASLYPSSMISENLSHDCIVLDPKYDNLPGVEYLDVAYDVYEGIGDKKVKAGERVCRFVQPPNGEKGIIPNILMKLLRARKSTRKKMEMRQVTLNDGTTYKGFYDSNEGVIMCDDGARHTVAKSDIASVEDVYNEFQKAVLDGLQQAYKVTANSLYGQIGAKTSPIYMKDIAACTTATGRKMIMLAKDFLEANYNANIVYGDSVASYTPVVIRDPQNNIVIDTIENIGNRFGTGWIPCTEDGRQDKEGTETPGIFAWTDDGWTALKRVIRHELAPHKRMLRVKTQTGVVDVTDDHSLIRENHDKVKPTDVVAGDALLHNDLPTNTGAVHTHAPVGQAQARYMGRAMANGSTNTVPTAILNSSAWVKEAFWNGMCSVGVVVTNASTSTSIIDGLESQLSAASLYALATSIGYDTSITICNGCTYRVTCTKAGGAGKNMATSPTNTVEQVEPISYIGYVYDLTTENHRFAAGIGRMVVSNTDSIFIVFPNTSLETEIEASHDQIQALKGHAKIMPSINTAIKASNQIKAILKKPHDLEYEKTFWPFILLSKKRYVGNLYETNDKKFKQKSMGIVLKRRDNAHIVKHVYGGIIDTILNKQDVPASVSFLQDSLNNLVNGRCPMEDLVITKSLRAEYKDPTRIAHKVLAERMGERDPGNKPQVNDRIPFVYVQTPMPTDKKEKLLQGERIEHPDYIKKMGLKPDYNFYITNQIMKPVLQLYSIIVDQLPNAKSPTYYERVLLKIKEDTDDCKKIKDRMSLVKENDVKELLFDPILSKLDNFKKTNTRIGKLLEKQLKAEQEMRQPVLGRNGEELPMLPDMDVTEFIRKQAAEKRKAAAADKRRAKAAAAAEAAATTEGEPAPATDAAAKPPKRRSPAKPKPKTTEEEAGTSADATSPPAAKTTRRRTPAAPAPDATNTDATSPANPPPATKRRAPAKKTKAAPVGAQEPLASTTDATSPAKATLAPPTQEHEQPEEPPRPKTKVVRKAKAT